MRNTQSGGRQRKAMQAARVSARIARLARECAAPAVEGVTVLNPGVALLMRMRTRPKQARAKVQG